MNGLVRFFFRMGVRDASGAFRCYRVSKLRDVRFDRLVSRGYSFQQEMLYRCRLAGCRLGETPIIFENRRAGKSKVNPKEAARSIATIVYLGVPQILGIERRASRPRGERSGVCSPIVKLPNGHDRTRSTPSANLRPLLSSESAEKRSLVDWADRHTERRPTGPSPAAGRSHWRNRPRPAEPCTVVDWLEDVIRVFSRAGG